MIIWRRRKLNLSNTHFARHELGKQSVSKIYKLDVFSAVDSHSIYCGRKKLEGSFVAVTLDGVLHHLLLIASWHLCPFSSRHNMFEEAVTT